jgi:endonuclease/exonuclease/phosphatase family metal-dependent hydrolase
MIVTGDFNTQANTERYRRFTGADQNPPLLRNAYTLTNAPAVAAVVHPDNRIDHILAGGPCQVTADSWQIDQRPLENGQAMSDHDPVLATLRFMP